MLFTFSIPRKYKENGIFVFEKTQQLEEIDDILKIKVSHWKNIKSKGKDLELNWIQFQTFPFAY